MLSPGATAAATQAAVQAAMINVKSGQTLLFAAGTYQFTDQLSLSVPGVTMKGASKDTVIFDFSGQTTGAPNGIFVTAGDFILDGFTIKDSKGDAVRVQGTDPDHLVQNVTLRNTKVFWSAGSVSANPGYALYPTTAQNVLIENNEVHNASDACLYVGQSKNIMIRNNVVSECENGIEVENSTGAEVMGNMVTNNVGGILVFNLPNLPVKIGSMTVVHDNVVMGNNHDKFPADPSGTGALTPPGTGMVIFSADSTEMRNNTVMGNDSTAVLVISCATAALVSGNSTYCNDPGYNSYMKGAYIHDNTFQGNGTHPLDVYLAFVNAGGTLEEIIWDGQVDPADPDVYGDNKLCIQNNGDNTFIQADPQKLGTSDPTRISTDLTPHDCTHPAVPSINVTWGME